MLNPIYVNYRFRADIKVVKHKMSSVRLYSKIALNRQLHRVSSVEIVSNPIVDYLPEEMDEAFREIKLVRDCINLKTSNLLFGSFSIKD